MEPFELIYDNYQPDLYRFLLRLTGGDPQAAEELTQETFYQAFLSFGRYRGDCAMKTWLCGIARHVYLKYVQRESRQRRLSGQPVQTPPEASAEEQAEEREQLMHIRAAMEQLSEPMRSVAEYRLCSELSYAEIAALLHIREGTAAVICTRAKQRLREILRKEYGYEI